MRFFILVFLFLCCLFAACNGKVKSKGSERVIADGMTPVQRESIRKYKAGRKKATDFLKLPESASAEEIRFAATRFLKLSPDTSWQQVLDVGVIKMFLTEKRRRKYVRNLDLPLTATWVEIGFAFEALREKYAGN